MSEVVINGEALQQLLTSPDGEVAKDLLRRAIQVHNAASRLVPVGTPESTGKKGYRGGALKASLNFQLGQDGQGLMAMVGANTDYAAFVELGTSKMAAKPYLLPALEAAQ